MFFDDFKDILLKNPTETSKLIDYLETNEGVLAKQKFTSDHKNFAGFFKKII